MRRAKHLRAHGSVAPCIWAWREPFSASTCGRPGNGPFSQRIVARAANTSWTDSGNPGIPGGIHRETRPPNFDSWCHVSLIHSVAEAGDRLSFRLIRWHPVRPATRSRTRHALKDRMSSSAYLDSIHTKRRCRWQSIDWLYDRWTACRRRDPEYLTAAPAGSARRTPPGVTGSPQRRPSPAVRAAPRRRPQTPRPQT